MPIPLPFYLYNKLLVRLFPENDVNYDVIDGASAAQAQMLIGDWLPACAL